MGLNKSSLAGRLEWGRRHFKRFTYFSSANCTPFISMQQKVFHYIIFDILYEVSFQLQGIADPFDQVDSGGSDP